MPVYVYACKADRAHRVEVAAGMFDKVGVWCPDCGERMTRMPGHASFVMQVDGERRRALDVHGYLKEKYNKNKERREINDAQYRKAAERAG